VKRSRTTQSACYNTPISRQTLHNAIAMRDHQQRVETGSVSLANSRCNLPAWTDPARNEGYVLVLNTWNACTVAFRRKLLRLLIGRSLATKRDFSEVISGQELSCSCRGDLTLLRTGNSADADLVSRDGCDEDVNAKSIKHVEQQQFRNQTAGQLKLP